MTLSREAVEGLTIIGTICMVHLAVILFCSLVKLALITKLNVHLFRELRSRSSGDLLW